MTKTDRAHKDIEKAKAREVERKKSGEEQDYEKEKAVADAQQMLRASALVRAQQCEAEIKAVLDKHRCQQVAGLWYKREGYVFRIMVEPLM